ncbi:hypothetical protein KC19_1G133900 [Ceratodon purpureus]|uniref:Uncharacterized protein n=1 Tax=Ceratodon purpureus TaxID=3225 RepID=A0A8T0J7R8_CERPU|nr:hypothetical protein KC19_1G133900 [Ceratodon purpureus]
MSCPRPGPQLQFFVEADITAADKCRQMPITSQTQIDLKQNFPSNASPQKQ